MKAAFLTSLGGLLSLCSTLTAAQLLPPNGPIHIGDKLVVVFDEAMVPPEEVGTVIQPLWLQVEPPVEAQIKWQSPKSLQIEVQSLAQLDCPHELLLTKGLKSLQGEEIAAKSLGTFKSPPFEVVGTRSQYLRNEANVGARHPSILLQFNDVVDLASAEVALVFASKNASTSVPSKVRYATTQDLEAFNETKPIPLWNEKKGTESEYTSAPRKNVLHVEPATLLPAGESWHLNLKEPFYTADKSSKLSTKSWYNLYVASIWALQVEEVKAATSFDRPHRVELDFNKTIVSFQTLKEEELLALKKHILIQPEIPDLKIELSSDTLVLKGSFELNVPYHLEVMQGFPAADGLVLEKPVAYTIQFAPDPAFVSTASLAHQAMSKGKAGFDFFAVNFRELRVRAKLLKLEEYFQAEELQRSGYDKRLNKPIKEGDQFEDFVSFENYLGTQVFERRFQNEKAVQQSSTFNLPWKDLLGGQDQGLVFIEIEAQPMDGAPQGTRITRSLVNVTDINAVIKNGQDQWLIYTTEMFSGEAIEGAQVRLLDSKGKEVASHTSNAQGIVNLPAGKAEWLHITHGEDLLLLPLDSKTSIFTWSNDIDIAWQDEKFHYPQVFAFTDRPLYKPGDSLHWKAFVRQKIGDPLSPFTLKPGEYLEAHLIDIEDRKLSSRRVQLDAQGNVVADFTLPKDKVGHFTINLVHHQLKKKEELQSQDEANSLIPESLIHTELLVQDYKPNSFEIQIAAERDSSDLSHFVVPIDANYYMGKPLSNAHGNWSWELSQDQEIVSGFEDYHFGHAPKYYRYIPNGSDLVEGPNDELTYWSESGEIELGKNGKATLKMPIPPPDKESLPQRLRLNLEITDVNQQTISKSQVYTLPGADFALGAKLGDWYARSGESSLIEVVAVNSKGELFESPISVQVKVERQEWNIVKMEGAGEAIVTKNQSLLTMEHEGVLQLDKGKAQLSFTPTKGGNYFLTLTSQDSSGKKLLTRLPFYSIGGGESPWAWRDGRGLNLTPQAKTLNVGEETTIMVEAPFAAKALITVERNGIYRHFLQDISPSDPVVRFKAEESDFPNAYVSVLLLRGAAQSSYAIPFPEYRLGYTEIKVNSKKHELTVELKPSPPSLQPKDSLTIETLVKDYQGQPVENANVTLYAVDEGVLSLVNYITPRAGTVFHQPTPLAVSNYIALAELLTEDASKRYRGNKGVIIGGGGDEQSLESDALRKNFIATAYWNPNLTTDASGKASATFAVPDSLTRYRVMAQVVAGFDRFGTAESAFSIKKPLMVEPVVPRFANAGDTVFVKALVHNDTDESGDFKIHVETDAIADILLDKDDTSKSISQTLTLGARESKTVNFQVRFLKVGETLWRWSTESVSNAQLKDQVESRFEVAHPVPALREIHYASLDSSTRETELLQSVSPLLKAGHGQAILTVSNSSMAELESGLKHILYYPYGCAEQTTSRLIPWLNLGGRFESLFPEELDKNLARSHIEVGVQRLLSLQSYSGGFGYWSSDATSTEELWLTSYVGFALLKAKDWGIAVPQEAIDKMITHLQEGVREAKVATSENKSLLRNVSMALYTLARAKQPEEALQHVLFKRHHLMDDEGRAFLALAMCVTNAKSDQILALLQPAPKKTQQQLYDFLGEHTVDGLRLIAYAHIGQKKRANDLMVDLLSRRNAQGHWGSTFSNAWILTGFATHQAPKSHDATPTRYEIVYEGKAESNSFDKALLKKSFTFNFDADKPLADQIKLHLTEGDYLYAKLEVKSYPKIEDYKPTNSGYHVVRTYHKISAFGELEKADSFEIGDMILVELKVTPNRRGHFLVIEDPLPTVFEAINPEFTTQNTNQQAQDKTENWSTDHSEIRHDRVLMFLNYLPEQSSATFRYLARVNGEGSVLAPPTKVEEMYAPNHFGLSDVNPVRATSSHRKE